MQEKANVTADCLENQLTPHDLCDENNKRRVVATVQALLETVDNSPERLRPVTSKTDIFSKTE